MQAYHSMDRYDRYSSYNNSYHLKDLKKEKKDPALPQDAANPPNAPAADEKKSVYERVKDGAINIFLIPIAQSLAESGSVYLTVGALALGMLLIYGSALAAAGACTLAFGVVGIPLIGFGMLTVPIAMLCILSYSTGIHNKDI